uniref:Uncharacterized protein n=1 Tax=Anguilla anguilla TaxID=7936 RepID=A0A0E9R9D0_ANGAN
MAVASELLYKQKPLIHHMVLLPIKVNHSKKKKPVDITAIFTRVTRTCQDRYIHESRVTATVSLK